MMLRALGLLSAMAIMIGCGPVVDFAARDAGGGDESLTDQDPGDDAPADVDPGDGDVDSGDSDADPGDGDGDDGPTYYLLDTFEREVTAGWGTPNTGADDYACIPLASAENWVTGGKGRLRVVSPGGADDVQCQIADTTAGNLDIEVELEATAGAAILYGRAIADYTRYQIAIPFGGGSVSIGRNVSGSYSELAFIANPTSATHLRARLRIEGPASATSIAVTVWPAGTAEPATPTLTATDTSGIVGRGVGVAAYVSGGTIDLQVDELRATTW